ncbi:MAG: cysteine--tRNA ligase [Chloroflexota bacterium]
MKVYSTLSRQKEEFTAGDTVRMYVCGVTPWDECHLGHAMSYTVFDLIRRYLEFRGYKVTHVQNFTDVDDKIINRAQVLGIPTTELTSRLIERYFTDMDALNIRRAHVYPRATEEIPKMLEVIQALMEKGYAYEAHGSVYFRVSRCPSYGKLSGRDPSQMEPGAPSSAEPGKESHLDFALWKASKPGEPSWDSPWDKGRPGWHIECTAMSIRYLGETLDIHGGGRDLIFPHHENEIAQSESYTGAVPFVRYWLHNGMVQIGEEKMSKSLGNMVTVRELLQRYTPDAIRLLIVSSHYRNPLTYSEAGLEAAEKGMERLRQAAQRGSKAEGATLDAAPFRQKFIEAMDDDFNTPQAMAVMFDLVREINRAAEEGASMAAAQATLRELTGVLGLSLAEPEVTVDTERLHQLMDSVAEGLRSAGQEELSRELDSAAAAAHSHTEAIAKLVEARRRLRSARQWQLADSIRSRLVELGITLEDTPQGTVWRCRK